LDCASAADPEEHILAAATKVFASEATRQVTLKRVALEARVPSEQLTERYGNAGELLCSVYAWLTDAIARRFPEGRVPAHGGDLDNEQNAVFDALVLITTRALLDGVEPSSLIAELPVIEEMTRQAIEAGLDERTARYRVYETCLLEFAHRFFARPIADVCGLADESDEDLRREVNALELLLPTLPPIDAR
jgi:AcrR family transcriptional regulator